MQPKNHRPAPETPWRALDARCLRQREEIPSAPVVVVKGAYGDMTRVGTMSTHLKKQTIIGARVCLVRAKKGDIAVDEASNVTQLYDHLAWMLEFRQRSHRQHG